MHNQQISHIDSMEGEVGCMYTFNQVQPPYLRPTPYDYSPEGGGGGLYSNQCVIHGMDLLMGTILWPLLLISINYVIMEQCRCATFSSF